jgi:hypothetical protein
MDSTDKSFAQHLETAYPRSVARPGEVGVLAVAPNPERDSALARSSPWQVGSEFPMCL